MLRLCHMICGEYCKLLYYTPTPSGVRHRVLGWGSIDKGEKWEKSRRLLQTVSMFQRCIIYKRPILLRIYAVFFHWQILSFRVRNPIAPFVSSLSPMFVGVSMTSRQLHFTHSPYLNWCWPKIRNSMETTSEIWLISSSACGTEKVESVALLPYFRPYFH